MSIVHNWRKDYEWFEVPWIGWCHRCCNCGIVHSMSFKIQNNSLMVKAVFDKDLTKKLNEVPLPHTKNPC
jgi:hypothetical protein